MINEMHLRSCLPSGTAHMFPKHCPGCGSQTGSFELCTGCRGKQFFEGAEIGHIAAAPSPFKRLRSLLLLVRKWLLQSQFQGELPKQVDQ